MKTAPADLLVALAAKAFGVKQMSAPHQPAADPHDVKLKVSWTKDQLKAAPSFERYKAASASSTTAPATNPRPVAPPR